MFKKLLFAAMLASSLGAVTAPASADIVVRVAPPPLRGEPVPEPRRGFIWVPGHWDWRGNHHVWAQGTWIRERPGYMYYEPRWTERDGRWHYEQGRWNRGDRDHDGIPNRVDRDRDGDGVPNRVDRRPDDPNRR
ncbi:YXWGXW repeat-containing protein [Undibacterium terreum]|uniref:YXWGXW repeat-containing protein n=1 Tax=Undibacterium terreum TaxID=1224302 RepID=A0A916UG67_9BURK|nr:YXWGXW repeat-containing protein [Undibacterium terreum]GGC71548.1 hypothetical protein GCM10011396_18280 [Undibacterium terreum]